MAKFFVYFIESPSEYDIYAGRAETKMLAEVVRGNDIPFRSRTVISEEWLRVALGKGLLQAMKDFPDHFPVSAHQLSWII